MPTKRKRAASLYTKKYRRRQNGMASLARPTISTSSLGRSVKAIHRYADEYPLDPGAAGSASVVVYSLNGMFDPYITGVGHQPMGFDQLNGLYNDYVVYGAMVEVSFVATDTANQTIVGASIYPGATTSTDYQVYMENPNTEQTQIGNYAGGTNRWTFKKYVDIGQVYGRTRSQLITEDFFKGNGAANPTDQVYLHLWGAGMRGSNPAIVDILVKITYYSQWFNPKLASKS